MEGQPAAYRNQATQAKPINKMSGGVIEIDPAPARCLHAERRGDQCKTCTFEKMYCEPHQCFKMFCEPCIRAENICVHGKTIKECWIDNPSRFCVHRIVKEDCVVCEEANKPCEAHNLPRLLCPTCTKFKYCKRHNNLKLKCLLCYFLEKIQKQCFLEQSNDAADAFLEKYKHVLFEKPSGQESLTENGFDSPLSVTRLGDDSPPPSPAVPTVPAARSPPRTSVTTAAYDPFDDPKIAKSADVFLGEITNPGKNSPQPPVQSTDSPSRFVAARKHLREPPPPTSILSKRGQSVSSTGRKFAPAPPASTAEISLPPPASKRLCDHGATPEVCRTCVLNPWVTPRRCEHGLNPRLCRICINKK